MTSTGNALPPLGARARLASWDQEPINKLVLQRGLRRDAHDKRLVLVDPAAPSHDTDPFSRVDGHVIAVRITAENASDGWKPTVGAISQVNFQGAPSVWGYFSVRTPGAEVHAYADSQFGHVFAHAPTRKQAAYLLQLALKRLRVVGEIHSNIP